jgi:hypothetical protein
VLGVHAAVQIGLAGNVALKGVFVAGIITALAMIAVGVRAPRLRPHPMALRWIVGVGSALAGADTLILVSGGGGSTAATAGFVGIALVLLAWRYHAVVPAIAAALPLIAVEGYAVGEATGSDNGGGLIVVGMAVIVGVAIAAVAGRGRARRPAGSGIRVEEVAMGCAVVAALVVTADSGVQSAPFPFTRGFDFGGSVQVQPVPTLEPLPEPSFRFTLPPVPTLPPFPTFPPG